MKFSKLKYLCKWYSAIFEMNVSHNLHQSSLDIDFAFLVDNGHIWRNLIQNLKEVMIEGFVAN
jgi:hypothetical protein